MRLQVLLPEGSRQSEREIEILRVVAQVPAMTGPAPDQGLAVRNQFECANGSRNVTQVLFAQIERINANLAEYLGSHVVRNADATRLGVVFESCRDIYAIAEEVAVFGNKDVSNRNTDTDQKLFLLCDG